MWQRSQTLQTLQHFDRAKLLRCSDTECRSGLSTSVRTVFFIMQRADPVRARRSCQTKSPHPRQSMACSLCDSRTCFIQSVRAPTLRKQRLAARTVTCQEASGRTPASIIAQPLVQESLTSRRQLLAASVCSTALATLLDQPAQAVQGYTAGRIPGQTQFAVCNMAT